MLSFERALFLVPEWSAGIDKVGKTLNSLARNELKFSIAVDSAGPLMSGTEYFVSVLMMLLASKRPMEQSGSIIRWCNSPCLCAHPCWRTRLKCSLV